MSYQALQKYIWSDTKLQNHACNQPIQDSDPFSNLLL